MVYVLHNSRLVGLVVTTALSTSMNALLPPPHVDRYMTVWIPRALMTVSVSRAMKRHPMENAKVTCVIIHRQNMALIDKPGSCFNMTGILRSYAIILSDVSRQYAEHRFKLCLPQVQIVSRHCANFRFKLSAAAMPTTGSNCHWPLCRQQVQIVSCDADRKIKLPVTVF